MGRVIVENRVGSVSWRKGEGGRRSGDVSQWVMAAEGRRAMRGRNAGADSQYRRRGKVAGRGASCRRGR